MKFSWILNMFPLRSFLAALGALLLSSCSYRTEKMQAEDTIPFGKLGFNQVTGSILGPKCAKCHEWASSYERVRGRLPTIRERITTSDLAKAMPQVGSPQLTPREKSALLAWIDAGGPMNPGDGGPPVVPDPPAEPGLNFAWVKQQVLKPKCLSCHKGRHDEDFDTYAHTLPLIRDIKARIRDAEDPMPPLSDAQLTPDEIKLLDDWINAGAPEKPGLPLPKPEPLPQPDPQPQPGPLNFARVKAEVLSKKCAECHHHKKNDDFKTYDKTKPLLADIRMRIHTRNEDDQMPPPNKPQLTPDELKLLDDWLQAGGPEF